MTREEFIRGWKVLEGGLGHQSPERAEATWLVISKWTKAEWEATCRLILTTLETFPVPAKICGMRPGQASKDALAMAAWEHVWNEKDITGPHNPHWAPEPHGKNTEPMALKAIGGLEGLVRLHNQQEDARAVGYMKNEFLREYKRLMEDASRGALYLDEPSRKSFYERGGVKSIADVIESVPLTEDEKEARWVDGTTKSYVCKKHVIFLDEKGCCRFCDRERAKMAREQKMLGGR